jgi:hypothetical protein
MKIQSVIEGTSSCLHPLMTPIGFAETVVPGFSTSCSG